MWPFQRPKPVYVINLEHFWPVVYMDRPVYIEVVRCPAPDPVPMDNGAQIWRRMNARNAEIKRQTRRDTWGCRCGG